MTLCQNKLVEWQEHVSFKSETNINKGISRLLDVLMAGPVECYEGFLEGLDETDQQELCRLLEEPDYKLNLQHRIILTENLVFMKKNLTLSSGLLLDMLFQKRVLDSPEIEEIKSKKTEHDQIDQLFQFIMRTLYEQYQLFLDCLNEAHHEHVYVKLTETSKDKENKFDTSIPSQRNSGPTENTADTAADVTKKFVMLPDEHVPEMDGILKKRKREERTLQSTDYSGSPGIKIPEAPNVPKTTGSWFASLSQKKKRQSIVELRDLPQHDNKRVTVRVKLTEVTKTTNSYQLFASDRVKGVKLFTSDKKTIEKFDKKKLKTGGTYTFHNVIVNKNSFQGSIKYDLRIDILTDITSDSTSC